MGTANGSCPGGARGAAVAVAAALLFAGLLPRPAAAQDSGPADAKGRLETLAPVTRRLLPLAVEKSGLRLDREAWTRPGEGKAAEDLKTEFEKILVKQGLPKEWAARQAAELADASDVEQVFTLLQTASRSHSTGRSSGGNDRSQSFSGGGLAGTLTLGGTAVKVELREEKEPRWSLEVRDDGEGRLRIDASDDGGEILLAIRQARGGRFRIAYLDGDKPFLADAESFQAFYRENREVVEKRLIPLLERLGVGAPLTAESPAVKEAVLSRLRPVTEEEQAEVERQLGGLDDVDHARREEATRFLAERAHRHPARVEKALKAASNSPEASARLNRVMAENRPRRRADELAADLKLEEDPACLVRLLGEATEADRPRVAAALEKATGQTFGADAGAWKQWLEAAKPAGEASKAGPPAPPRSEIPPAPAAAKEGLEKLKSDVYDLLRNNKKAEARAAVEAYRRRFPGQDEGKLKRMEEEIDVW